MKESNNKPKNEWTEYENSIYEKPKKDALACKAYIQMAIGVIMVILIFLKGLYYIGLVDTNVIGVDLSKLLTLRLMHIISLSLLTAAGVDLAYMFFTPGPDEAIQPVLMSVAAFIIYQTSSITKMTWSVGLGFFLMALIIPLLLYTSVRYEDYQKSQE